MRTEKIFIYGKHALIEALTKRPDMLERIYLTERLDGELAALVQKNRIATEKLDPRSLPRGVEASAVHQGYVGCVRENRLVESYADFVSKLSVDANTALVVLGEVQDPQNVGAIIRTAAAFGVAGVLIPEHNQAQVTGTVVKVSAGMAFNIPLVSIGNVNTTLKDLKDRGFWIYGLAGEATHTLSEEKFDAPTVFVLGNESTGIREHTLEMCDVSLSIPMHPECESLNVAASAAITLYAWSTHHPLALREGGN